VGKRSRRLQGEAFAVNFTAKRATRASGDEAYAAVTGQSLSTGYKQITVFESLRCYAFPGVYAGAITQQAICQQRQTFEERL